MKHVKKVISLALIITLLLSPMFSTIGYAYANEGSSTFENTLIETQATTRHIFAYKRSYVGGSIWYDDGIYRGYLYYRGIDNSVGFPIYVYSGICTTAPAAPNQILLD